MTDMRLYLAVGLPVIAILVSTLVNVVQFSAMNGRISSLDSRLDAGVSKLDARIDRFEARVDARIGSLEAKFDMLTGKVIEMDNRLTRLEERLSH